MTTTVTKTIKASGGDYTTLSAFITAIPANLVTADQIWVAECYNFELSNNINITGKTTDATRYIEIKAASGEGHGGVWGTGFTLKQTGTSYCVTINNNYVKMHGFTVKATTSTEPRCIYIETGTTGIEIHDMMIDGSVAADYYGVSVVGIRLGASETVYNNVIKHNVAIVTAGSIVSTAKIYNNTLIKAGGGTTSYGIRSGTGLNNTPNVTNNVVYGFTSCFAEATANTMAGSHNASSDSTSSIPGSNNLTSIASSVFYDYAANSFKPAAGASIVDAGTDGSAYFTTDITGATRTGTWDMGAYEYASAGQSATVDAISQSSSSSAAAAISHDATVSAVTDVSVVAGAIALTRTGTAAALSEPATAALGVVKTISASIAAIAGSSSVVAIARDRLYDGNNLIHVTFDNLCYNIPLEILTFNLKEDRTIYL